MVNQPSLRSRVSNQLLPFVSKPGQYIGQELNQLVSAGDWDRARKRHHELRVLNQMLFVEPSPAPTKAALSILGRCSTEIRLPLVAATAGLVDQLRNELRAQGML